MDSVSSSSKVLKPKLFSISERLTISGLWDVVCEKSLAGRLSIGSSIKGKSNCDSVGIKDRREKI